MLWKECRKLFAIKYFVEQIQEEKAPFQCKFVFRENAQLKSVTLRDDMSNLNLALERLKSTVIRKCWHNILQQTNENFDDEDNNHLAVLKLRLNDEDPEYAQIEFINNLKHLDLTVCDWNDVLIWNEDRQPENEQEITEDEDSDVADGSIVTHKLISTGKALKFLSNVIQWAEENSDYVQYSRVVVLQDLIKFKEWTASQQRKLR